MDEKNNRMITLGHYMPSGHEASRVFDPNGIVPTVKENHGTTAAILIDTECIPCAMRGRYQSDGSTEQQLEFHNDGIANTVTTIEKDCMVLEHDI